MPDEKHLFVRKYDLKHSCKNKAYHKLDVKPIQNGSAPLPYFFSLTFELTHFNLKNPLLPWQPLIYYAIVAFYYFCNFGTPYRKTILDY